jgi:enoyl-CoA hydratase
MPTILETKCYGAVLVITLNRPPANALNRDFFVDLEALAPTLADPAVRAVVVTGTGRFFSAGLDLFQVFSYPPEESRDFIARFDRGFTDLFALDKPMVAAVNGHALAGGAVLAACADFRLMADGDGKVGVTEIQVGVPFPSSALEIVRFACAGPHLPELLYQGRTYPPREAAARRLVDEVVPAAELMPRAMALATELAALSPVSFSVSKRALRAEFLGRIAAAHARGEDPVWAEWRTPETKAAMEAFRARAVGKRS